MARSISDEEVQHRKRARRRLVGAVVLATAVAVVLPMVLDTEPKPVSHNVNIQIPSPDSAAFAPRAGGESGTAAGERATAPAAATAKPESAAPPPTVAQNDDARIDAPKTHVAKSGDSQKADGARSGDSQKADGAKSGDSQKAVAEASKPAESRDTPAAAGKETKPAPKEAAAKDAPKAVPAGKFVVQIAALADTAKAKQLQQQVAGTGVKAYTEVVKTAKGDVTRVRAGPYDTREAAEKARGRLKTAGLDGKVVPR